MIPKQIIEKINYLPVISEQGIGAKFRNALEEMLGHTIRVVMLGRARMGLYLLVKYAMNHKPGRTEVVLSPYTIPDVINMVILAGGQPVFVDFYENTTNIDLNHLESLVGDKTACCIVTHYHVNQAEISEIIKICRMSECLIFEDRAISFSDLNADLESDGAVYSFSSFKLLNYFWGGAIALKNAAIYRELSKQVEGWPQLHYVNYAPSIVKTLKYDLATSSYIYDFFTYPYLAHKQKKSTKPIYFTPPRIESTVIDRSLESRPSNGAYKEWLNALPGIKEKLSNKRQIAAAYNSVLDSAMLSRANDPSVLTNGSFNNYPILLDESERDSVYRSLILDGFDVGLSIYPNCHKHEKFRNCKGKSANVEKNIRSIISLPTHSKVSVDYATSMAHSIRKLVNF
jgi:perosamine synthetase